MFCKLNGSLNYRTSRNKYRIMTNYKLAYENYYSSISSGLINFQQNEEFVDMTLAADGHLVKVHKNIVSLASPYIKEMIKLAPCPHPVVYLSNIKYDILCILLEYIYTGEVDVPDRFFSDLVQAAKELHIVGLSGIVSTSLSSRNHKHTLKKGINVQSYEPNIHPPNIEKKINKAPEDANNANQYYIGPAASVNIGCYSTTQDLTISLDQNAPVHENPNFTMNLPDNTVPEIDSNNLVCNQQINTDNIEMLNQEETFTNQYLKFSAQGLNSAPINIADTNISTVQDTRYNYPEADIVTANDGEYQPNMPYENQNLEQNNPVDLHMKLTYSQKDINPDKFTLNDNKDETEEISINLSEIQKSREGKKSEIILGKPMYTLSKRGQMQIIFNRFIYSIVNTTKKGIRQFRCIDYRAVNHCPAFIAVEQGMITQRKNRHCHEFHDDKIEEKIKKQLLYENFEEADRISKYTTEELRAIRDIGNNVGLDIDMDG